MQVSTSQGIKELVRKKKDCRTPGKEVLGRSAQKSLSTDGFTDPGSKLKARNIDKVLN